MSTLYGERSTAHAQDTRHTRKLLNHFGVRTLLVSFHEHNEHGKQAQVLTWAGLLELQCSSYRHTLTIHEISVSKACICPNSKGRHCCSTQLARGSAHAARCSWLTVACA